MAEGNLNEEAVQDVEGISVKLSYRANIEAEIPLEHITNYNTEEGIQSKTSLFANFETQLVGFYKAILKWQVGSLLDVSKGNSIGKFTFSCTFRDFGGSCSTHGMFSRWMIDE